MKNFSCYDWRKAKPKRDYGTTFSPIHQAQISWVGPSGTKEMEHNGEYPQNGTRHDLWGRRCPWASVENSTMVPLTGWRGLFYDCLEYNFNNHSVNNRNQRNNGRLCNTLTHIGKNRKAGRQFLWLSQIDVTKLYLAQISLYLNMILLSLVMWLY